MTNALLNNESLEKFIGSINLDEKSRNLLLEKVPKLDLEERKEMFESLTEIYLLDIEEKEAIERVKKFWKE